MSLKGLLEILADGQFHSGEELGAELGVSRSAVWKQLKKLQTLGVDHYSVKGRGYRIPDGLDLLDVESLSHALDSSVASKLHAIDLQLSVESTNVMAMDGIRKGQHHGFLYLAERQTAGKGRRGRSWVSPFARNLYFSLIWSFNQGAAALEGLSLLVGLAIVRGLERCEIEGVELKWPNDLLFNGKKLAGILLEMSGDASGVCQVVIGVGVNVKMPDSEATAIDQPWIDLSDCLAGDVKDIDRNLLLASILNELIPMLDRFSVEGFAPFKAAWQQRDAFANRKVRLQTQTERFEGLVRGVQDNGALLLETDQGVQAYHGGELSLRAID